MAIDVFIGIAKGEQVATQAASTTSKAMELQLDKAVWTDRGQALAALRTIEQQIIKSNWPA